MNLVPVALLNEESRPGRRCMRTRGAERARAAAGLPAEEVRAAPPALPEIGELDLVRHFTRLSQKNFAISTNFYPLGSCTMKYNPLVHEATAGRGEWAGLHPWQDPRDVQGALRVMHELARDLGELTGLPGVTLHPAAGAQGELSALLVLRAYFDARGESHRRVILIPDSAHGTNPASCTLAGFRVVTIHSDERGLCDPEDVKAHLGPDTAGLMITNPNTLGLFEENIAEISRLVHAAGGKVYMDGANFNAIVGVARPADFGVDMMHLNLHKTMSTPHGGGGPGAGPICVTADLAPYLPNPRVVRGKDGKYALENGPESFGRLRAWHGNFLVLLRAWLYVKRLGAEGLRRVAENAVLNANYLRVQVAQHWRIAYDRVCMHEFVVRPTRAMKDKDVHTMDVAKRLIELGFHPPTVYFPLVVNEAIMIEPTETESKETLDGFAAAMAQVAQEALAGDPGLHAAPRNTPVGRVDEARAVKEPRLCWQCGS